MRSSAPWILPDWPAPPRVRALTTTRFGGVSLSPFDSLNLAQHVGDRPESVAANRNWLKNKMGLLNEPLWLHQGHGTRVVAACVGSAPVEADGAYTGIAGPVCAVLTADCLPVLLCARSGAAVAVAHAGWRGLAAGVVEAAVGGLHSIGETQLMAWLGPAIGPLAYVVGDEVRTAFVGRDARAAEAFTPAVGNGWHADLYRLARQRLLDCGVEQIFGGGFCTHTDHHRFYSFRRDGNTGRMASMIWLQA